MFKHNFFGLNIYRPLYVPKHTVTKKKGPYHFVLIDVEMEIIWYVMTDFTKLLDCIVLERKMKRNWYTTVRIVFGSNKILEIIAYLNLLYRYMRGQHKVSEVDIFGKIDQEKTRRLIKLGMLVIPLCISLFWYEPKLCKFYFNENMVSTTAKDTIVFQFTSSFGANTC